MNKEELMPIIDALIFASDAPLSIQKIKQILDDDEHERVTLKDLREAIEDINKDNKTQQRGFYLQEVAGGYQFRTRPNYAQWVKKLKKSKPFRLTQSTLETLAIIAYKQPLIRAEIDKIRGVDSGGVIKNLLERNLIKLVGRKNIPGRPFLLGTTNRFLEVFGLEKLADMPSLKEFDSLDDSKLPTILREKIGEDIYVDEETLDDETREALQQEQAEMISAPEDADFSEAGDETGTFSDERPSEEGAAHESPEEENQDSGSGSAAP
ncbi:MAG: SMC-Scp complex subunit ScpB [Pseudomonadota bacterium]